MELSIVIPVFNEEENISVLVNRIVEVITGMPVSDYELVFVNDGSTDNSLQLIRGIASENPRIKYISFSRNFGHQIAVTAGLEKAQGDEVVILDADMQDPPEIIPEMHQKLQEGFDVVYARRKSRSGESVFKKFTAKLFYRILARITHIDIPLDTGDFRIMRRSVLEVLKQMPEQQKFVRGQIAWVGFSQTYVDYHREERQAGKSNYNLRRMLKLGLDGLTSFSDFPLRFATISGFVVSGVTFILMLYALHARFFTDDFEPGWTSLILSVLFIGGIQLISIGIIGEYISRISANVRNRPLYIVQETNIKEESNA